MAKGIIFLIFVVVALIGIFAFVYFFYEKPVQESAKVTYYNITIRTFDRETGKQTSTGVLITLDGSESLFYNGSTSNIGYLFVQIPKNRTFTVFNYNIGSQKNYIDYFYNPDLNKDILSVDLVTTNISEIKVSHYRTLGKDNPVYLQVISNGTVRNVDVCFSWSPKIIKVFTDGAEITIPKRLEKKVNVCYYTKQSVDKNFIVVPIRYQKFGEIDDSQYINVYVLDGDVLWNDRNSLDGLSYEDKQGNDIGGRDIFYVIKNL